MSLEMVFKVSAGLSVVGWLALFLSMKVILVLRGQLVPETEQ
jgi:hypothetical protein